MNDEILRRNTTSKHTVGAAGAIGATAAACAACCISAPFVAPVVAWFALSSFGAISTGWYVGAAVVFAVGLAILRWVRSRRAPACAVRVGKQRV